MNIWVMRAVVFGPLIGLVVFFCCFAIWHIKRVTRNARWMANKLGLDIKRTPRTWLPGFSTPYLAGMHEGRAINIRQYSSPERGDDGATVFGASIHAPNAAKLKMQISARGLPAKLARYFHSKAVKTGDGEFDSHFCIKTGDAKFMQAALVPEARAKIMELWLVNKLKGRVRLESDTLKYEEKDCGFWSKSACIRVAGSVELLGVLADIVDAHGETK